MRKKPSLSMGKSCSTFTFQENRESAEKDTFVRISSCGQNEKPCTTLASRPLCGKILEFSTGPGQFVQQENSTWNLHELVPIDIEGFRKNKSVKVLQFWSEAKPCVSEHDEKIRFRETEAAGTGVRIDCQYVVPSVYGEAPLAGKGWDYYQHMMR